MSEADYYDTLGVSRNASEAEIKKNYRRLAMKYHPDRNKDNKAAEKKFKEVLEAYSVLSDKQKRQAYDDYGHAGVSGQAGGAGGFQGGFADMGDIFSSFFGGDMGEMFGQAAGRGGRRAAERGADLVYNLSLSLEDAVFGKATNVRIPNWVRCETCAGQGAAKGTKKQTCSSCGGQGQLHIRQGFLAIQQTCHHCSGTGKVIKDPCRDCQGQGRVRKNQTLAVKIPAGISDGDRVRLSGKGEVGQQGGAAGDLYVQVHVKPHKVFEREGNDLLTVVPLDFATAALGGEMEIPTLSGRVKLRIPAGSQHGKLFRLRGKGVQSLRQAEKGDLLCRIVIEVPINLTQEQKQYINQLSASLKQGGKKHSPQKLGWLDSVKKFFSG